MKITYTGTGKVELLAGGGKIFTDMAARFCRSERPLAEIVDSLYSADIVRRILASGHKAALEFDYFIFGVEGYSRVCETQLVRKRMASYLINAGLRLAIQRKTWLSQAASDRVQGRYQHERPCPARLLCRALLQERAGRNTGHGLENAVALQGSRA